MIERCAICGVFLNPAARPPKATCDWGNCVHEYRRRIWAEPGVRACLVCGRRVRAGVAGDTCGGAYCRQELDSRLYRMRRKLEQRAAQEAAAQKIGAQLQQSREAPPDALMAVLPAHDRRLGPQEPGRRAQFAERLAGVMDEAIADLDGSTGDPPYPEAPASPGDALARSACASCRGL